MNHKYISLVEHFNADKLFYIINNQDQIRTQMRSTCFDNHYNPFILCKKYLDSSRNGERQVKYKQKNGKGRFFAIGSLSMQSLSREIRHTIQKDYIDIDMVNAHPVILFNLCKKHKIKCKYLKKYVNDRETYLNELSLPREKAKQIYLSLTNGGQLDYNNVKNKSIHLKKYRRDSIKIIESICNLFKKDFDKHKLNREKHNIIFNHGGSFLNTIMCDIENTILMKLFTYLNKPNNAVLCFDGIMIKKQDIDLNDCNKFIRRELNINIDFKMKSFDKPFRLPENIPKYIYPRLNYFSDYQNLMNKDILINEAYEWLNNSVVLIDNYGNNHFLTKHKMIHRYQDKTTEAIDKWTHVKQNDLVRMLKININVINNDYDPQKVIEYNLIKTKIEKKQFEIKYGNLIKKYLFNTLGFNIKKKEGFIEYVAENRYIKTYNNIQYIPYLLINPASPNEFNIFSGFPLLNLIPVKHIKFVDSLLYTHLQTQFFNNNEDELNHFLDHIADIIQNPDTIKGVAHLFYSPQGCGKGLLAKFMNKLLGINNVVTIINTDDYFESRFNSHVTNKLLKIFEEVSEKGSAFKNHNRLKGEITSDQEKIEKKNFDSYINNHYARFWFFTNNINTLYVEHDCRRYTFHKINSKYANDISYFKPIWELISDQDFMISAFNYFKNRKYKVVDVMKAFDTKYKNEQKQINLSLGIKFLIDFIQTKFKKISNESIKISAKYFDKEYKNYCCNIGSRYHLETFRTQLSKLGLPKPKRLRLHHNETHSIKVCYIINSSTIRQLLRTYLKIPSYDFSFVEGSHVVNDNDMLSDFSLVNDNNMSF